MMSAVTKFLFTTELGRILGLLTAIITLLKTLNLWSTFINYLLITLGQLATLLFSLFLGIPIYFWLLFLTLTYHFYQKSRLLRIVAGEFTDDFSKGLGNWEFGGEGWKTEFEDGMPLLSVSSSSDGGISNKGFNWSDYEFGFKGKVINKSMGWIIRAENRNKYLMIQLNFEKDVPRLRLHLRIPPLQLPDIIRSYDWMVMKEDDIVMAKPIKLNEWFDTRIVVLGSTVDVYLNKQHVVHYYIPDPIRWSNVVKKKGEEKIDEGTYVASINYSSGKVGFRCYGDEHSHVRDLRVTPLLK